MTRQNPRKPSSFRVEQIPGGRLDGTPGERRKKPERADDCAGIWRKQQACADFAQLVRALMHGAFHARPMQRQRARQSADSSAKNGDGRLMFVAVAHSCPA